MYGLIAAPPSLVERMIALSIAYVAFGLLHGIGFAGALRELGLPRSEFLTALLAFNTGVEAGQLAVIAAATVLIGWRLSPRIWYRQRIVVPASALIAVTPLYWTIARLGI